MAALENPKYEQFCLLIMAGKSQSDAYRESHPKSLKWKNETVWAEASKTMADPKVRIRIAQLREELAERSKITIDDLVAELEEARRVALSAETPQASAAIAGTMGKAKLLGYDKQVMAHVGADGGPIQSIMRVELVALLADDNG